MANTDSILGTVVNKFNADTGPGSLTVLVSGGLWTDKVPDDVQLLTKGPYGILVHIEEVPDWTFETNYKEMTTLQFIFFAIGAAKIDAEAGIIARAKTVFDWCSLTYLNKRHVKMERTRYQLGPEEYRAPSGGMVFHGLLEYQVTIVTP